MEKNKSLFNYIFYYFIIISFLLPKGYTEYSSTYHTITTIFTWMATLAIWVYYFFSVSKKNKIIKNNLNIFSYFIYILIITFFLRGFLINGLQKLICYPSIFLFIIYAMKENPRFLLNTMCNVMLVNFLLNMFVMKSFFSNQFHITFLGHVQLISQLGLLAVFCSLILITYYKSSKLKSFILLLLSLYTMFVTDASTAHIALAILLFMFLAYCIRMYHFLRINTKIYIVIGIIISILIIYASIQNNLLFHNANKILDFNGRSFIWISAFNSIKLKPIFGYGIEGKLLKVFWSSWTNPAGFNYTHNQIIQNLLDGGIIGLLLFWKMVTGCVRNINKINEIKYKLIFNSILIVFLAIMIVESVSLYCYFYMFLAFALSFYKIENKKKRCNYGNL